MTQQVQEKTVVRVTEEKRSTLKFSIPENLLPDEYVRLRVFQNDNLADLLPADSHSRLHKLYALCAHLMPRDERCGLVDHINVIRSTKSRTLVEVQLAIELVTRPAHGRVDSALRACGYQPVFGY